MSALTVTEQEQEFVQFESAIDRSRGGAYMVPNEDVEIWRDLVKGRRIDRAAAICSGGEVGFFALLPTVRKELVLVDHNIGSLRFAMLKYLLLREHGYAGVIRLLKDRAKMKTAINAVAPKLPEKLRDLHEYAETTVGDRLVRSCPDPKDSYSRNRPSPTETFWANVGDYQRRQATSKLNLVKFLHGDLLHLVERGPFDLLYLSNAQQVGNGNDKAVNCEALGKCLKPGGSVLSSVQMKTKAEFDRYYTPSPVQPESWKLVKTLPRRDKGNQSWNYCLYQVQS